MALNATMFKEGRTLVAREDVAINGLQKFKEGAQLKVVVTSPRSLPQLRLLFGMLAVVKDAQPDPPMYPTTESLLDALKKATGHMTEYRDLQGITQYRPSSIAFENLDQHDFNEWFEQAIRVIIQYIVPNCPKKGLEERLYEMMKQTGPQHMERR